MRRLGGFGLAAFECQEQFQHPFSALLSELSALSSFTSHCIPSLLLTALQAFAFTHREPIRSDPAFLHTFQKICASTGVDPMAGHVCVSANEKGGGVIEIGELARLISNLRGVGRKITTEDDVVRSIKTLNSWEQGMR